MSGRATVSLKIVDTLLYSSPSVIGQLRRPSSTVLNCTARVCSFALIQRGVGRHLSSLDCSVTQPRVLIKRTSFQPISVLLVYILSDKPRNPRENNSVSNVQWPQTASNCLVRGVSRHTHLVTRFLCTFGRTMY